MCLYKEFCFLYNDLKCEGDISTYNNFCKELGITKESINEMIKNNLFIENEVIIWHFPDNIVH